MDAIELRSRTKLFTIDLIRYLKSLSNDYIEMTIAKQLLRSGSSLAANYRAACRGRSKQEFFSKLSIVVEETDETMFWLEILIESGIADNSVSKSLLERATEFIRIFSKARKTVSIQLKS
jgi:four helix bundle protein